MLKPICPIFQAKERFFYETSLHYRDILDTYNSLKDEVVSIHKPWTFVPIYDVLGVFPNQVNLFETIKSNFPESDDYVVSSIGISSIRKQDGVHPHKDNHPKDGRFRRMHLALQLTPTSKINVLDDSGHYQEYKWDLGKWMEFDGVKYNHYPENLNNEDRIILIVDAFIGGISNTDMFDYYNEIERLGWIGKDFIDKYKLYIKDL